MGFEHFPPAIGAKIDVVHVNSTTRPQNTKRFQDVVVTVPGFEVHALVMALLLLTAQISLAWLRAPTTLLAFRARRLRLHHALITLRWHASIVARRLL